MLKDEKRNWQERTYQARAVDMAKPGEHSPKSAISHEACP